MGVTDPGGSMNRSQSVRVRVRAAGVLAVVGVVALVGGCGNSGHPRTMPDPATAPSSPPKLTVVLNDGGLQLSSTTIRAGRYQISFRDERSHPPAGDHVALAFGPSGPRIALVTVPAGGETLGTLIANDVPWVTVNGVANFSPGGDPLTVETTPEFPTPAT
jgi:hypothetical protein